MMWLLFDPPTPTLWPNKPGEPSSMWPVYLLALVVILGALRGLYRRRREKRERAMRVWLEAYEREEERARQAAKKEQAETKLP